MEKDDKGAKRRRRGRPAMSPEARKAAQERRIPSSYKGRLRFRPGDPHVLDAQLREARNYDALISEQLAQLQKTLAGLGSTDVSAQISQEENALKAFLWQTYQTHKHRDHILATFLAIRRQRLLARLDAARNALELASELLTPDDRILRDLRHAIEQAKAHTGNQAGPNPQGEAAAPEKAESQQTLDGTLDDPAPDPLEEAAMADQQEARAVDHRHIYGDANELRGQLAAFDERVKQMRAAISMGIGWFEEYYIYKERLTYEARQYMLQGKKPPDGVPLTETVRYGPYLKWRIRESGIKGAPIITVQMGLIPDNELAAARVWQAILGDSKENEEPWPHL